MLERLAKDVCGEITDKPFLFVDNQSAINLIKNPQYHCRTKHIDIKYKFVRDKHYEKFFELNYINTKEPEADILTKALERKSFEGLRSMIGLKSLSEAKWLMFNIWLRLFMYVFRVSNYFV